MLFIILFVLVCVMLLAKYFSLLFPPQVTSKMLSKWVFFYKEASGKVTEIGKSFEKSISELKAAGLQSSGVRHMGLYPDDPTKCKDGIIRWCYGFGVDMKQVNDVRKQLEDQGYKMKEMPEVAVFQLRIPYRNTVNFYLIGFYYRHLFKFINSANVKFGNTACIEEYKIGCEDPFITLNAPFNKNSESYLISSLPEPKKKE